ncbi:MAG: sigma-54-dependent transcriptional regulator [Vicinamibacterales bacterium]
MPEPRDVTGTLHPRLALIDDEAAVRTMLAAVCQREGFEVVSFDSGDAAIGALAESPVDVVLVDLKMPGINGLDVLRRLRESGSEAQVVLMSGVATAADAMAAVKLGATDFLAKPVDMARVRALLRDVRESVAGRRALLDSDAEIADRLQLCGMIGRSPAMQEIFTFIRRVAPYARSALVLGETGTGKELVARAFHALGPRRARPFVVVNCSALVESLAESELFGHVRGAFTGAVESKVGLFEHANGGTLFLDEVGELAPGIQSKLLRVLESGEVMPVGGVQMRTVDVWVIAATNRELQASVADGTFRSDLYYRLNLVEVRLPALRDRRGDIPYLTSAFIRRFTAEFGLPIDGLTPAAEDLLHRAPWPGNVRELRNVIERACMLAEGRLLGERDVTLALGQSETEASAVPAAARRTAVPTAAEVHAALTQFDGNKAEAARHLGVTRRSFYRLLDKYGDSAAS